MSKPEGPSEARPSWSDHGRGHGMHISVRMPLSSAHKLGLLADGKASEVTVTLTSVEFAGRLTLATGAIVTPEALERYVEAWKEASATLQTLIHEFGEASLAAELHGACEARSLWVPQEDAPTMRWLFCVLEAHFLSSHVGTDMSDRNDPPAAIPPVGEALAELCERSFPLAHHLWTLEETRSAVDGTDPRPRAARAGTDLIGMRLSKRRADLVKRSRGD